MKIKHKLFLPIIIQIILAIIIWVGSNFLIKEMDRIKNVISENMTVSSEVQNLGDSFTAFYNGDIAYSTLISTIYNVSLKLPNEIQEKLKKNEKQAATSETLFKNNIAIKQEIMDSTSFSISQSNEYISDISAKLGAGASVREVSLLERAVIAGANESTVAGYEIQVRFLMLEHDLSLQDDFFRFIDAGIEQSKIDIELLNGTDFEALPRNSYASFLKTRDLAMTFTANTEMIEMNKDKSIRLLNELVEETVAYLEQDINTSLSSFVILIRFVPFILSAIVILIIVISILILRSIAVQITSMSMAMQFISSEGDLSTRIEIKSKDELGAVSNDFNDLVDRIRNLIIGIKSSTELTNKTKENIVASSDSTSATIRNIKNNTSSLLGETEILDRQIEENMSSVTHVSSRISDIDDQMAELVAMVEESSSAITEMMSSITSVSQITGKKSESINQLVSVVTEGSATLNEMAESFKVEVLDKIHGISEMAETIQSISSQTNLLSMNAAIEAAHAGDAGKGFAVVADEIRKLAETSSSSTASITQIIKEISEGVQETGVKTQKSSEAFGMINKEMQEAKHAFDEIATSTHELNAGGEQILGALSQLNEVTAKIKNASEDIAEISERIVESQHNLKNVSNKVTKGMNDINTESENIVTASEEIVQYSSDLDSKVNDLKVETEKFKT